MIGIGTSSGAITIVNALFTGLGAAAAVSLPVEARVELTERPVDELGAVTIDPPSASPLARESIVEGLRRFAPDRAFDARLSVRSSIPPSRGLKSSSAIATAVLSAVARALGAAPPTGQLATYAADVGERVGLSATGAFDDALASIGGGAVVTENRERRLVRRIDPDPDSSVLLWIPRATHRPSPTWAPAFARKAAPGRAAADLARRGEFLPAILRNTELVEEVMGYADYRALREELRRQGARGAGVSGMGPTLAVIAPADRIARLRGVLPPSPGEALTVDFRPAIEVEA
ncbi:MAG: shikimate kinase [Thermoplasmata archaeon]